MAKSKPSLFAALKETANSAASVNSELVRQIPVDKLVENPLNRFSMKEDEDFARSLHSIEQDGLFEDLIVTPAGNDTYRIISGHRRAAIAKRLGKVQVPCKVRVYQSELEEVRALIGANIHKRTITPLDMARQLETLSEVLDRQGEISGIKERVNQLAEQTGLSPRTVERYLDLLQLNPTLSEWVEQGKISMTDAYELSRKKNLALQEEVVAMAMALAQNPELPLSERLHTALEARKKKTGTPSPSPIVEEKKGHSNPCKAVDKYRKTAKKMADELETISKDPLTDADTLSEKLTAFEDELEHLLSACKYLHEQCDKSTTHDLKVMGL